MYYQSVLKKSKISLIEKWLEKVEDYYPGKYNVTDLKKNGKNYLQLLLDMHIQLEEHPEFDILPMMCEYHARINTPIEDLLQSSYIWREVIAEYIHEMQSEYIESVTELLDLMVVINKRIDDIQKVIVKHYWQHAHKKMEQTQRQVRDLHEDRLSSLGKMAASMAHELKNPLFAIEGFIKLIRNELPPESLGSVEGYLDVMEKEFKELYGNISSFLAFSKNNGEEEVQDNCTVNELIESVLRLVRPRLSDENIKLKLDIKQDGYLCVQKIGMQQVISNLVNNSIDALSQITYPKSITIRSWEECNHYLIQIEDNGTGIPNELKETIFEPFVTNKKHGTGLGLAICRQIVQKNCGTLSFDSVKGKTTFTIAIEKTFSQNELISKQVI